MRIFVAMDEDAVEEAQYAKLSILTDFALQLKRARHHTYMSEKQRQKVSGLNVFQT